MTVVSWSGLDGSRKSMGGNLAKTHLHGCHYQNRGGDRNENNRRIYRRRYVASAEYRHIVFGNNKPAQDGWMDMPSLWQRIVTVYIGLSMQGNWQGMGSDVLREGDRMKLEIPVEVDLNGIDGMVDEIKCLQKYKLSEGDDMVLVSLDDVAEILINHIEAKRKSEPQRMRGKWVGGELGCCSICGHEGSASDIWNGCKGMFCPNCGADMRGTE